jgi:septum formation protein
MPGQVEPYVVLASASPRRRLLLDVVGVSYRVRPADIDERQRPGEAGAALALRAAREKALAVSRLDDACPVLGSDTVVEIDGVSLGKPESRDEAAEMLRRLSNATHSVHTGLALAVGDRCEGLLDTASVRFAALSEETIQWYLATDEPMDKAGAYAIQGRGGLLVAGIDGSPHTVVGLPIHRLPELFARLGLDFWDFVHNPDDHP